MKKCAIYIRVSTKLQAEQGFSLGEQAENLKKYADANGWQVLRIYSDDGFSGASLDRPAMKLLIDDIKTGLYDLVLVDKLDRLARSLVDTMRLLDEVLTPNNCALVSRAETFDTGTPFGRATVAILSTFAEMEKERIKDRLKEGAFARVKSGKYRGCGTEPYGYNYIIGRGLEINPLESEIVKRIYKEAAAGRSASAISEGLIRDEIPPKRGGRWTGYEVTRIIKNPLYCGKVRSRGEIFDGIHDKIITEAEQERAAEMLEHTASHYKAPAVSHLLAGFCRCAWCGAVYQYKADKCGRAYFRCASRNHHKSKAYLVHDPECKNKIYRYADFEKIIISELLRIKDANFKTEKETAPEFDGLKQQKSALEIKIKRLMQLYAETDINPDYITGQIKAVQSQINALDGVLKQETDKHPRRTKKPLKTLKTALKQVLEGEDITAKRRALSLLIDKIEIDGENVNIFWAF